MVIQIKKRDGRIEPFCKQKIVDAIIKAMGGEDAEKTSFATVVAKKISDRPESVLSVEQVQDLVEQELMSSEYRDTAKRYIVYRAERTRQRNLNNVMLKKVMAKTTGKNVENANANVDEHTFGGRRNEAASIIQKEMALESNMPEDVARAHKDGLIYQHDLDFYNVGSSNCLFLDFKRLFENGFKTRNCDVRPPNSLSTACQLVAVALQLQSQCQFGGCASAHIDTDLAPFVKKSFFKHFRDGAKYIEHRELPEDFNSDMSISDPRYVAFSKDVTDYAFDMLNKEGSQSAEGLYHNLGTLESRAGSQVPFSSLNLGRDTTTEGRLVSIWLLNASIKGIGKHHRTPIFPITIFSYKKGINTDPGDPNYDLKQLAIKSLSKRIFPNFANGDWSEAHEDPNDPDTIFATMG